MGWWHMTVRSLRIHHDLTIGSSGKGPMKARHRDMDQWGARDLDIDQWERCTQYVSWQLPPHKLCSVKGSLKQQFTGRYSRSCAKSSLAACLALSNKYSGTAVPFGFRAGQLSGGGGQYQLLHQRRRPVRTARGRRRASRAWSTRWSSTARPCASTSTSGSGRSTARRTCPWSRTSEPCSGEAMSKHKHRHIQQLNLVLSCMSDSYIFHI